LVARHGAALAGAEERSERINRCVSEHRRPPHEICDFAGTPGSRRQQRRG
jgi:hypothetical protein